MIGIKSLTQTLNLFVLYLHIRGIIKTQGARQEY